VAGIYGEPLVEKYGKARMKRYVSVSARYSPAATHS